MEQINEKRLEELKREGTPLVIDFFADWCGPCKTMGKLLEELEADYEGKLKLVKCNVEDEYELADEFHIRNVPTLVFVKGDTERRITCALKRENLKEELDAFLGSSTIQ